MESTIKVKVKQKDIIVCNARWTKGNDYYFVVTFVDNTSEWVGAFRILLGGDKYRNEANRIPSKFLGTRAMDGFVNVFTGGVAIHRNDITEVRGELSSVEYSKLIGAFMQVLTGKYTCENGNYRIKNGAITIDPAFLIASYLEGNEIPVNKPITKMAPKTRVVHEEVEEDPVDDEVEEVVEEETEEMSREDFNRDFTKEDLDQIIDGYNSFANGDERLQYIYRIWQDMYGRISPSSVYNSVFLKIGGTRALSKKAVVVSKDEFMMLINENMDILAGHEFTTLGGDKKTLSRSSISTMRSKAMVLYNNRIMVNKRKSVRISEDMKKQIDELYKQKLSNKKICEHFGAEFEGAVRSYIYVKYSKERSSKVIKTKLLKLNKSEDKDIVKIARYFISKYESIASIAAGRFPENFPYDKNKSRMIAIYVNVFKMSHWRIAIDMPEYIKSKDGIKLFKQLVSTRIMSSYSCLKHASIASKNEEVLRQCIFGAYRISSKDLDDKFISVDSDLMVYLKVNRDQYIAAKQYVIENYEEMEKWFKNEVAKEIKLGIRGKAGRPVKDS